MRPYLFRLIICGSLITGILGGAFDMIFPRFVPLDAVLAIEKHEANQSTYMNLAFLIVGVTLIPLMAASTVGLILFRPWSRPLAVATGVTLLVFWPLLGTVAQSGWSSSLIQLANMGWGFALAIAYFSSISEMFGSDKHETSPGSDAQLPTAVQS